MQRVSDRTLLAPLLEGWEEGMLWAYLSGRMGTAYADHAENPRAALVRVGDFSLFAGEADRELAAALPVDGAVFTIAVPRTAAWTEAIELSQPRAKRITRFAFHKRDGFDRERLWSYTACLPPGYTLHRINGPLFYQAAAHAWSRDLVSQYGGFEEYAAHGAGFAVLHQGELVCGASSYVDWPEGIEIEIDCQPAYRRRGLARACAARLILDCLAHGRYPSWDAANPVSAHLAETLGYRPAGAYPAYEIVRSCK